MIRLVRQEDACGCVVASLAMVTGRSYAEVKAWFVGCDFDTVGIGHDDAETYLGETGYASVRHFRRLPQWVEQPKRLEYEMVRDGKTLAWRDPWPSKPFAPSHLIGINGGRHCAVMLADGTVLDPMFDAPRHIGECGKVSYVIGVFKVGQTK